MISGGFNSIGNLWVGDVEHKMMIVQVSLEPSLFDMPIPTESVYCGDCEYGQSQNQTGDPVNTHNCSMSLPVEDLGFPTTRGTLSFVRNNISPAMVRYISHLDTAGAITRISG
jgi:hypothetical protein